MLSLGPATASEGLAETPQEPLRSVRAWRHPFRIREIALQAGLSEATVDRVLHRRGGVRRSTVARGRAGRSPTWTGSGPRCASAAAPSWSTSSCRRRRGSPRRCGPRWRPSCPSLRAGGRPVPVPPSASRAGRPSWSPCWTGSRDRGSHGVILKAPDVPEVTAAVQRLGRMRHPGGHPGDRPAGQRSAWRTSGIDNRAAGATAAYLLGAVAGRPAGQRAGDREQRVVPRRGGAGDGLPRGHARRCDPAGRWSRSPTATGLDARMRDLVRDGARRRPGDRARSTHRRRQRRHRRRPSTPSAAHCAVFVAHDLDEDNTARCCTAAGCPRCCTTTSHQDMRRACRVIMQAHGALPHRPPPWPSTIQIVTPYNMPAPPD